MDQIEEVGVSLVLKTDHTGKSLPRFVVAAPLIGREWQRGTVHVAVVDEQRNMVAATPSGGWIADSPVVEGLGFPLGTTGSSHPPSALYWLSL